MILKVSSNSMSLWNEWEIEARVLGYMSSPTTRHNEAVASGSRCCSSKSPGGLQLFFLRPLADLFHGRAERVYMNPVNVLILEMDRYQQQHNCKFSFKIQLDCGKTLCSTSPHFYFDIIIHVYSAKFNGVHFQKGEYRISEPIIPQCCS